MDDRGQDPRVLRFGIFEVEPASRELRKGGALIKLQSQHFQLLALLAERAGQVVSREEIRRALWDNATFVDFDQSINYCVNKIRVALDDDPQSPRYIETLPRQGYRFIAPMIESRNGLADAPPIAEPGPVSKPVLSRRWWLLAGAGIALVATVLAAKMFVSRHSGAKPIESLAVLPLENLSHDPEQDYFADGMTDELITALAKISALRVISRTSVMQYKGTKKPVPQIARELNVGAVLEGTVTREQGRVRITVQVIGVAPEKHLWAERYEGSLSEVLTLQDAVARAVAREIQIKITPREQTLLATPRKVDPAAYEAYLKGRYLWERSGEANLTKSREYFEKAIDKDPGYALAWAGLADTYNRLANWGVASRQDASPRARAAAEKALELENSLVGPVVALAEVKMQYEWDWAGAERLFKRAIELSPGYGPAHQNYALYLAEVGRPREAAVEARRAHEAEPLSGILAVNVVWFLYIAHQYDQAELESRKLGEWDPSLNGGYILASVYLQTGRQREAIAELQKSAAESHRSVLDLMYLGHGLGVSGARAEGQKVLEELRGLSQQRYVPPEFIAVVYEGLGERNRALQWFEKAYTERSMHAWILPDPRLDPIRSDPRFRNLMRRMGLPQ
jgi:TolB-like protein/DNA-binding winged helix-turn-helix (wHTH) protein/Tfp pilus assembly protein PilF